MNRLFSFVSRISGEAILPALQFTRRGIYREGRTLYVTGSADLKIAVFFSGAIIMVLEILGFRILAPQFGYSVYVSGSLIGIVMMALSAGYYFGGKLADWKPRKPVLFLLIFLADIHVIIMTLVYTDLIHYLAQFGLIYGSLLSSFIIFGPSMILLGMAPPFIIRLMAKDISVVGRVAGDITAIGTVGSIIGTFGATFLLIPKLGSHTTMVLCAVVLLLVAVLGLEIRKRVYALLAILILAFNVYPGNTATNIIYQKESPYNLIKVTKELDGSLYLKLNTNQWFHSIFKPDLTSVDMYFDYMNTASVLADAKDILVLGMGGGTSVLQSMHYFPDARVDAVELDPGVIEVGRKYFGLKEGSKLHIFEEDARPFLQNSLKMYDVIQLDVYHGGVYAPFYIMTQEFFSSVYDHLKPNGVLVMNVLSPYQEHNRLVLVDAVGKTISTVFPSVYKIDMFLNHLLFATKSDMDLGSIRSKLRSFHGDPELKKIAYEASNSITVFTPAKDAIVLTDDKSPVAEITYRMMSGINDDPNYAGY